MSVACCLCKSPFYKSGNLIWLKDGPAHFSCWVEEIKRIPVSSEPIMYDPNLIYANYYDAMTMKKLHPAQVVNRMNKRQFYTFFSPSYQSPDMS